MICFSIKIIKILPITFKKIFFFYSAKYLADPATEARETPEIFFCAHALFCMFFFSIQINAFRFPLIENGGAGRNRVSGRLF